MTFIAPLLVFLFLAAPGLQLLRTASRTRELPELWCGLYFVGASIGISLRIFGTAIRWQEPEVSLVANSVGHLAFAFGTLALTLFTQRVFHPGSTGAKLFAGLLSCLILTTTIYMFVGGYTALENSSALVAANAARLIPTAWAFFESFRFWRSMRRRSVLGLADPVVTNRFLLWSIWTGGVSILPLIALVARMAALFVFGDGVMEAPGAGQLAPHLMRFIQVTFLIVVPASVVALCLAFFPPAAYLRRVRERAEAASGEAAT